MHFSKFNTDPNGCVLYGSTYNIMKRQKVVGIDGSVLAGVKGDRRLDYKGLHMGNFRVIEPFCLVSGW
jgi:hypothetical protein